MRRRDFVVAAGGVVLVAGSAAAAARQVAPALPVVAFLHSGSSQTNKGIVAAFGLGLQQNGYQDGKNIRIEYRWAEDRPDQIKALAAELLRRPVAAVAANSIAALSVKSLTTTVPIVFQSGIDPVAAGLVASLGHPGGNATGVSFFASTMEAKKLELLRELMPQSGSRRRPGQSGQSAGRDPDQRRADRLGDLGPAADRGKGQQRARP